MMGAALMGGDVESDGGGKTESFLWVKESLASPLNLMVFLEVALH